jgi:hypothetical protein
VHTIMLKDQHTAISIALPKRGRRDNVTRGQTPKKKYKGLPPQYVMCRALGSSGASATSAILSCFWLFAGVAGGGKLFS